MASGRNVTWLLAARFTGVGEAEAARSALDAAGIDCEVADDQIVGVSWEMSQAVGGIKLKVDEQNLDAARAIIFGVQESQHEEWRHRAIRSGGIAGRTQTPRIY